MRILMDGQELTFTLEAEKTVGDVLQSLEKWLAQRNSYIESFVLNGTPQDLSLPAEWAGRDVASAGEMILVTGDLAGIETENALEVLDYLARYVELGERDDPETVSAAGLDGLGWVITSVRLAAGLNMINLLSYPAKDGSLFHEFVRLESLIHNLKRQGDKQQEFFRAGILPLLKELLEPVRSLYLHIARRKENRIDPLERAEVCQAALVSLQGKLGDLSTDLQTGNEQKAMQAIQETTLHLDNLFTFIMVVKQDHGIDPAALVLDGQSLEAWTKKMTNTGSEIIAAFSNNDSVLLGDLFEYEIGEELDRALAYVGLIKEALLARKE
jgi:hypothetical protein